MIESYSFGSITVDGKTYSSDLIIYPERIDSSWWRKVGHSVCLEDLEAVLEYEPEILIFGKGKPGYMDVPKRVQDELRRRGIEIRIFNTTEAVKEFNKSYKLKKIVAALHLSC